MIKRTLGVMAVYLTASMVSADQIAIPHPPQANTQAKAAEMKANLDTIVEESNKQDERLDALASEAPRLYWGDVYMGQVVPELSDRQYLTVLTEKNYVLEFEVGYQWGQFEGGFYAYFSNSNCTGQRYAWPANDNLRVRLESTLGVMGYLEGSWLYVSYSEETTGIQLYELSNNSCSAMPDTSSDTVLPIRGNDPQVTGFDIPDGTYYFDGFILRRTLRAN